MDSPTGSASANLTRVEKQDALDLVTCAIATILVQSNEESIDRVVAQKDPASETKAVSSFKSVFQKRTCFGLGECENIAGDIDDILETLALESEAKDAAEKNQQKVTIIGSEAVEDVIQDLKLIEQSVDDVVIDLEDAEEQDSVTHL